MRLPVVLSLRLLDSFAANQDNTQFQQEGLPGAEKGRMPRAAPHLQLTRAPKLFETFRLAAINIRKELPESEPLLSQSSG